MNGNPREENLKFHNRHSLALFSSLCLRRKLKFTCFTAEEERGSAWVEKEDFRKYIKKKKKGRRNEEQFEYKN